MKKTRLIRLGTFNKQLGQVLALLVIMLFINLPIVSALEISNVRVEQISDSNAVVKWDTDEASDSFIDYGLNAQSLVKKGDANLLTNHQIPLSGLSAETTYQYKVESNDVSDDNGGKLYSFKTLPPDTEAPKIEIEFPEIVQGNRIPIVGLTEAGAEVTLFLNDGYYATTTAQAVAGEEDKDLSGRFEFPAVFLSGDQSNSLRVEVEDSSGNKATVGGNIVSDTKKPVIEIPDLPELVGEKSIKLKGTVSEEVNIEIFVNNKSVKDIEGTIIDIDLKLNEGSNFVKIVARDAAGWEAVREFTLDSDTKPPTVKFDVVSGTEYYEGRAETDIVGTTEPGASVYLYIFRQGVEGANFKRANEKVKADDKGEFKFSEVSFPPLPFTSLKELSPREVPKGLQDILIASDSIAQEQRKTYRLLVLAEDRTGKVGHQEKKINVNTCFSGNFDFDISPHPEFPPMPFRLDPGLMEEGRENIQAVFEVEYKGQSLGRINPATNEVEKGYDISRVIFQKACTRDMAEKDDYALGCKLLPGANLRAQPNQDQTAFFVTANLNRASEFVDKEDNIWDDFVNKQQLKFPLKIMVTYREREGDGSWGQSKTQPVCQDLGYFVDVPIDKDTLAPDFLVNQALPALDWTIEQIDTIKEYLDYALMISGVTCVASFLGKTITKVYRIWTSNFEPWLTKLEKDENKKCPNAVGQNKLYLDDTISAWNKLSAHPDLSTSINSAFPTLDPIKDSLNSHCPKTAAAWELEKWVDQAYRNTCDRFLCRPVPARWTENADEQQVKAAVEKQLSCSDSGKGAYLEKVENCRELLKKQPTSNEILQQIKEPIFECYKDVEGTLYYVNNDLQTEAWKNVRVWKLSPVGNIGTVGIIGKEPLLAHKPENSEKFSVGVDISCDSSCKRTNGYGADPNGKKMNDGGGCYLEEGLDLKEGQVKNGYTKDCFIDQARPEDGLYQCVCKKKEAPPKDVPKGAREALKKDPQVGAEPWIYRQDRVYSESQATAGTLYPKWRYYDGRDWSGAFGLNYGLDNFNDNTDIASMKVTKVDPHQQWLGTFQSVCLRGIYARLTTLQSALVGVRQCIEQAKYTGLQDAGMCKTLFTQYFCGMIYRGITYLASDCSPLNLDDLSDPEGDYTISGVEQFFAAGSKAIPAALDSSIQEVQDDYGDANFKEFFATGSQGFAESLCLAAFGYDFPMGMDFIMDTAYSFSTSVDVMFPIAERELSTYDPIRGTTVYNYNLGGFMLPGCDIRGYRASLKCIGPEDQGKPGVDNTCLGQGCDCLQATGLNPQYEGERTKAIDKGSKFGEITKSSAYDFPFPSPQKVSSHFRYDHVVLEIFLNQFENTKTCFEGSHQTETGGLFYFPIRELKSPVFINCNAQLTDGRFVCPSIGKIFGGGATYLEHPFVQCYDKNSDSFVDCQTPNLFVLNNQDQIVVKPYLNLGGESACLSISDNHGLIQRPPILLPENQQGPYQPRISLTSVSPDMISGGRAGNIITDNNRGDNGCGGNSGDLKIDTYPSSVTGSGKIITFNYVRNADGTFTVSFNPNDIELIRAPNYDVVNGVLTLNGHRNLDANQVNTAQFKADGFTFSQVLGNPTPKNGENGQCVYRTNPSGGGSRSNTGNFRVNFELFKPGPNENCYTTKTPMPSSQFGKVKYPVDIRVQKESMEVVATNEMFTLFNQRNYDVVIDKARQVVDEKTTSLRDALAIYYWIASFLMKEPSSPPGVYKSEIKGLLILFFERNFGGDVVNPYPAGVTDTSEYKKIHKYLCEISQKVDYTPPSGACSP
jgi:hypothetical protein